MRMALLLVFVGALVSVQHAVVAQNPQGQPVEAQTVGGAPNNLAAVGQAAEDTVQAKYMGLVTWGYLRMHNPEVVVGLLRDVQAQKLPPSALNGLATPAVLKRMQTQNWEGVRLLTEPADLIAEPDLSVAVPTSGPGGGLGGQSGVPVASGAAVSGWDGLQLSREAMRSKHPEYAPKELGFGGVWDGQSAQARLHLVMTVGGTLTASLPDDSPFRVKAMYAYSGALKTTGPASPMFRAIAAKRTAAPWTLKVRAGQEVDVVVAFEPHFDFFRQPAGNYSASLVLASVSSSKAKPETVLWRLKVPVRGRFLGVVVDAFLVAPDPNPVVVKAVGYDPDEPEYFEVPIKLNNPGAATTGSLKAASLPTGVTMEPIPVTLAHNERQDKFLRFRLDRRNTEGLWHMPSDVPYPMTVRFDHDGKSAALDLTITLVNGVQHWATSKRKCGDVNYWTDLFIYASGDSQFCYRGMNDSLLFGYTIRFTGQFDGTAYVACSHDVLRADSFGGTHVFNPHLTKDQYLGLIRKWLSLRVETF